MFTKKTKPPETVAEAIAPFRQVQDGLMRVLDKTLLRKDEARRRIKDAKSYAAKVEEDETRVLESSDKEMKQAEKIAKALADILGEEVPTNFSKTDKARAAKLESTRKEG